ncbi:MAG: hypothetical protein SP1CHLAM54_06090 [Chlamydiia bacterium]|nr:hypothetical protein [Chlamydiia bacterium]MCH9615519.1 hypothetical protein [Chlamydiia bacterium]MCH9629174.1 hypothetical protein [Chlamydiia bacterium]
MSIALDIDGTLTNENHVVSQEVTDFLHELYDRGFEIMLVTGRAFALARNGFTRLDFPFKLAVQNGADVIQMPDEIHLESYHLNSTVALELDKYHRAYLAYQGYHKKDYTYYRPQYFSEEALFYFAEMEKRMNHPFIACDHIPGEPKSLIKCLGSKMELDFDIEGVESSLIRDPFNDDYYFRLITHKEATKGGAVKRHLTKRPIIAAGDDMNDFSMLKVADIAIAKAHAPDALKEVADIVSADIVAALTEAINR